MITPWYRHCSRSARPRNNANVPRTINLIRISSVVLPLVVLVLVKAAAIIIIGSSAVTIRVAARIVGPAGTVLVTAAGPNIISIITVVTRSFTIGRVYRPSERSPKEPIVVVIQPQPGRR
jgi:hypothetical protein